MNVIEKQNPFSLYDFLGYFVPGAFFVYTLAALSALALRTAPVGTLRNDLKLNSLEIYLPFVIVSYVVGHLLSFVSSLTVEQYALWQFGYPSHYLLGGPFDSYRSRQSQKRRRRLLEAANAVFLLPISLQEQVIARLGLRELYVKPLDKLLTAVISKKIGPLLREKAGIEPTVYGKATDHDYFRYVYHFTVENAPTHFPKMQNYVALYGFLRTVALILTIDFWFAFYLRLGSRVSLAVFGGLAVGLAITSLLSFLAFVKFLRRFTLESLMAMSVVYGREERASPAGA